MFSQVTRFLGQAIGIPMIFIGFVFAFAGAACCKLGVWIGSFKTIQADDISDEELKQIIREAEEAQRRNLNDED